MADRSKWLTYDWHVDDSPAEFSVDMSLYDSAGTGTHPLLVYISLNVRDRGRGELNAAELRRVNAFAKKLHRKTHALYAGRIDLAEQAQLYFYAEDKSAFAEAKKLAEAEKKLYCRAGFADEVQWQTYLKLLYPDAPKYQTELNREHIEKLVSRGDNPEAARKLRFHMFFPTEPLLLLFLDEAKLSGFALGDREYMPEMENAYGVMLLRISTLNKHEVDSLTTRTMRLAARYDGVLDFWDCQIIPKKAPLS